MRPCAFRPPLLCSGRTSDFSGVVRVISAKSDTLAPRRPGVVGLYLRMPISSAVPTSSVSPGRLGHSCGRASEHLDRLALGGQRHDRALGVLALAEPGL